MRINYIISLQLILVLLLSTGCATLRQTRQLKKHRVSIKQIAYNNTLNAEEKIDLLSMDVIEMMDQALHYLDPRKGAEFLERYSEENEKDIDVIMEEFSQWQDGLDMMEKVAFGVRLVQKPYVKDLSMLAVQLEKKYKQVKFVTKLALKLNII